MPVFINEVVVRGRVGSEATMRDRAEGASAPEAPVDRQALVEEVTEEVLSRLDRHLERYLTER